MSENKKYIKHRLLLISLMCLSFISIVLAIVGFSLRSSYYHFSDITGYSINKVNYASYNYSKWMSAEFELDKKFLNYLNVDYRTVKKTPIPDIYSNQKKIMN